MHKNITKTQLKQLIELAAEKQYGVSGKELSNLQLYKCVARVVRDLLLQKRADFNHEHKAQTAQRRKLRDRRQLRSEKPTGYFSLQQCFQGKAGTK